MDPALRWYGVALACGHCLAAVFWLNHLGVPAPQILADGANAYCWPFFPNCYALPRFSENGWKEVFWLYFVFSGITGWAFHKSARFIMAAWLGLSGLSAFLIAVILIDFRMRQNHHYLTLLMTLPFLFFTEKRRVLPWCLVIAYFSAGLLKPFHEWMSGSILRPSVDTRISDWTLSVVCTYVVLLELVLVFGLLAKRQWIFLITILQLMLFHVFSIYIVGLHYPLLMFLLLSVTVLFRCIPAHPSEQIPSTPTRTGFFYLLVILLLQFVPYTFPGDSRLHGQGRIFTEYMFYTRGICKSEIKNPREPLESSSHHLRTKNILPRISCDPIVFWNITRNLCRKLRASDPSIDIDWKMISRRSDEVLDHILVDEQQICSHPLVYDVFHANAWLRAI